jgi:hypothetical protein
MGTLMIVMIHILLRHLTNFLQGTRSMHLKAFLVVTPVIALHIGITIGTMRRADVGLHTQTQQKATECRGKISSSAAAHPSGVAIKGEDLRQPVASKQLDNGF